MNDIIEAVSTTSSEVPVLSNIFAFLGDILQAGYDFVNGLIPEADPETPDNGNGDGDA